MFREATTALTKFPARLVTMPQVEAQEAIKVWFKTNFKMLIAAVLATESIKSIAKTVATEMLRLEDVMFARLGGASNVPDKFYVLSKARMFSELFRG
jgi:Zn-finger domain-containing protein